MFDILAVTEYPFIIKMKEYLFSYGTLQNDKVQLEIFGRLLTGAKDILRGYKIASIEIKDEAFLPKGEQNIQLTLVNTVNETNSVEGVVFEISENELLSADTYEPKEYKRIKVKLESGQKAWAYTAADVA